MPPTIKGPDSDDAVSVNTTPLRVGIMVDSTRQPRWIRHLLEGIRSSGIAEIVLFIERDAQIEQYSWRSKLRRWHHWLYFAYTLVDGWLHRPKPDAFEPTSIDDLVADLPRITITPRETQFSDYFSDADVEAILANKLDVALRLGFRILRGKALEIARYGVWSFHHGDNRVNRGGPAGFWEVMESQPVTGSVLQILSDDLDAGRAIYRSWSATIRKSVRANRNAVCWKTAEIVLRKLRDLAARGDAALTDEDGQSLQPYCHPLYRVPTNWEMTKLLARFVPQRLGSLVDNRLLHVGQWFIAYHLSKDSERPSDSLFRFRHVLPPRDRYWADPFPVHHQGSYFIFLEEFMYRQKKGHISVMELTRDGLWKSPVKVLELPHHLSYPFVFWWRDTWHMIPESQASGCVTLYRCTEFPTRWERVSNLLENVRAVDATLLERDGLWWMFANIAHLNGSTCDELHVFFSDSPLGPWKPHRKNPVKSDVRSARPAGRLFWYQGRLIRPAQDCSIRYGYAMVFHEVRRLTTDEYDEVPIFKITPQWRRGLCSTHTFNWIPGLTVIDGGIRIGLWL